jgi:uncharacterized protein YjbI with pentapeptide repeats
MVRAKMDKTTFQNMVVIGANFSYASLKGAELNRVFMYNVDLSGADLSGASFSGVALIDCKLSGINLMGIKYDDSILQFLARYDLQDAKIDDDLKDRIREIQSTQMKDQGKSPTTLGSK